MADKKRELPDKDDLYKTVYHKVSGQWLRRTIAGLFSPDFMRFRYIKHLIRMPDDNDQWLLEIGPDTMAMANFENDEQPPDNGLTWGQLKEAVEKAGVDDETRVAGIQVLLGQSPSEFTIETYRLDDPFGVVVTQKFNN